MRVNVQGVQQSMPTLERVVGQPTPGLVNTWLTTDQQLHLDSRHTDLEKIPDSLGTCTLNQIIHLDCIYEV